MRVMLTLTVYPTPFVGLLKKKILHQNSIQIDNDDDDDGDMND